MHKLEAAIILGLAAIGSLILGGVFGVGIIATAKFLY